MVNQQALKGNWHQIKGKLHSRWGQLSDDELEQAHGDLEHLIGTIQEKTGTAREEIEHYLEELTDAGQDYARDVTKAVEHATHQVADAARRGYDQAQQTVQRHPFESLAACLGVGLISGIVVGLLLKSR